MLRTPMKCTQLINPSRAELHSLCGLQLLPTYVFGYFVETPTLKRGVVKSARVYVRRNTHYIVSDGKIMNKESVCHTIRTGRSGGLNPERGKIFFSSSQHSERLWDPPNILFSGYWVYFSEVKREVDCAHLCSVSRLRINGAVRRPLLYAVVARTRTVVAFPYLISVSKISPKARKCWPDCPF